MASGGGDERQNEKLYLPTGGRFFGWPHCRGLTSRSCQEHNKRVDLLRKNPEALHLLTENAGGLTITQAVLILRATITSFSR